jgi:hypothetical protein
MAGSLSAVSRSANTDIFQCGTERMVRVSSDRGLLNGIMILALEITRTSPEAAGQADFVRER